MNDVVPVMLNVFYLVPLLSQTVEVLDEIIQCMGPCEHVLGFLLQELEEDLLSRDEEFSKHHSNLGRLCRNRGR